MGMRHADLFGAIACHSGDSAFELCFQSDFPTMFPFQSLHGRFQWYELNADEPMFAQGRRISPKCTASPLLMFISTTNPRRRSEIHRDVLLSIGRLIITSERFPSLCGFDYAANGIHNDHGVLALGNHILVRGSLNRAMHTV